MTGGRVIILGRTGRNFAAGMSGGIAYVLDAKELFKKKCNMEMVDLETVNDPEEIQWLKATLKEHRDLTGSEIASRVLTNLNEHLPKFVKVFPRDYKAVLAKQKSAKTPVKAAEPAQLPSPPKESKIADIEDSAFDNELALKKPLNLDKIRGFMKYKRDSDKYRNPMKRVKDWKEVNARLKPEELQVQAARCMGKFDIISRPKKFYSLY
jgi:glutamate synthase (NADPH/NADH)